jgi:hypothetical protein
VPASAVFGIIDVGANPVSEDRLRTALADLQVTDATDCPLFSVVDAAAPVVMAGSAFFKSRRNLRFFHKKGG